MHDFTSARIMVLGDCMLDNYISGEVQRISPEAPVPVASVRKRWQVPGGAANVARNLSRLGASVFLAGLAGMDATADILEQALAKEGVESALVRSASRLTTSKTRVIAQGQQLLRLDEEIVAPPDKTELDELKKILANRLAGCNALLLSDYGKGVLLRNSFGQCLCEIAIREAKKLGLPVLVDPKGGDWQRYANADCVTPNSSEFALACAVHCLQDKTAEERAALAEGLMNSFSLSRILLTRGARGMSLYQSGRAGAVSLRAAVREVADVSGAGDTVIATLAACIAIGLDWDEGARVANIAAGVAVGKAGTAPVSLGELAIALQQASENPKLYALPKLLEKLEEWRRAGQSIVFTNGCFDLLHPGHISLLRQASELGDRLVVGLNSDSSVRRLKGESRPIQNEQSRALLLSALQAVDAVVLFDTDTPFELIKSVMPDVLVKGSDYSVENVVGADIVMGNGGRVFLASLIDGCSTTSLVKRMATS